MLLAWSSVSCVMSLPLAAFFVVNPDSAASGPDGRHNPSTSPCRRLPAALRDDVHHRCLSPHP